MIPSSAMIALSKRRWPRVLQREDPERSDGRHQAGDEQRHPEQQVQRDRRADELGEVGRHRDQLGLDPQPHARAHAQHVAAHLGQAATGRDAELRRQVLDQHGHQVRGEDDPQQQVAVLGATGDVGGEVARVDVGDAGDERRAEQRQRRRADPARARRRASSEWVGRGSASVAVATAGGGGGFTRPPRRASRASGRRRARGPRRRSARTAGPSNGCFSMTSNAEPGAIPRSAR